MAMPDFPEETAHIPVSDQGKASSFLPELDDGGDDVASTCASSTDEFMCYPVDFQGCEKVICKGCNKSASDPSPLNSSKPNDRHGGRIPWASYIKVKQAGVLVARKPHGSACNICKNVFRAIGWLADYESQGKYFKQCSSTPASRAKHQEFLAKVQHWIDCHNQKDGRIKNVGALKSAGKTLNIVQEGGRQFEQLGEFVCLENWDEKLDGKLDESKIVEEMVFGKLRKGIHRHGGRVGVFQTTRFDKKFQQEKSREADDEGAFGQERFENTKRALVECQNQAESKRAANTLEAPASATASDLVAMLKVAGVLPSTGEEDAAEPSDPEDAADPEDSSLFQEEESEMNTRKRFATFFGGGAPAAPPSKPAAPTNQGAKGMKVPKPSDKNLQASGQVDANVRTPQVESTASSSASVKSGLSAAVEEREALHLDGRTCRIRNTLQQMKDTVQPDLEKLADFTDPRLSPSVDKEQKEAFRLLILDRKKLEQKVMAQLKGAQKRIQTAKTPAAFALDKEWFNVMVEKVQAYSAMYGALGSAHPVPDEFINAMDECSRMGGSKFPLGIYWREFQYKLQYHCTYNDYAAVCAMLTDNSADVERLKCNGASLEDISKSGTAFLLDCIVEGLRGMKETEAKLPPAKSAAKQRLAAHSEVIISYSKEKGSHFLALYGRTEISLLYWLFAQDAPPEKMKQIVDEFDTYQAGQSQIGEELGPIKKFFFDGNTGSLMIEAAREEVNSMQEELLLSELVDANENLAKTVCEHAERDGDHANHVAFLDNEVDSWQKHLALVYNNNLVKSRSAKMSSRGKEILKRFHCTEKWVWERIMAWFKESSNKAVMVGLHCAHQALKNDGMCQYDSEDGQKSFLLDLAALKSRMWLDGICSHSVFAVSDPVHMKSEQFQQIKAQFSLHKQFCTSIFAIVECAIVRSSAKHRELHAERTWSAPELAAMTGKAVDSLIGVMKGRLLAKETCQQFADLAAAVAIVAKKVDKDVLLAVKILVDVCVQGKGITKEQVSDLVKKLPQDNEDVEYQKVLDFSKRFLQTMQRFTAITPKSPACVSGEVLQDLKSLDADWPTEPEIHLKEIGLDQPEVRQKVQASQLQIEKLLKAYRQQFTKALLNELKKANTLLKDIDPENESQFREKMQKASNKMAKAQTDLKATAHEMKSASEYIGETPDADILEQADVVDNRLFYNVCVFSALCFFRNPDTFKNTTSGKKKLQQMRLVLQAMNTPGILKIEVEQNHGLVVEMRTQAEVPQSMEGQPSASGQVVANGVAEGSNKRGCKRAVADEAAEAKASQQKRDEPEHVKPQEAAGQATEKEAELADAQAESAGNAAENHKNADEFWGFEQGSISDDSESNCNGPQMTGQLESTTKRRKQQK